MEVVGLTGNIGSGKSTIAKVFVALGIPVFNSDDEAKKAYAIPSIQNEVKKILGIEIDFSKDSWKSEIASIIFSNVEKRLRLEKLIHSFVQDKFVRWKSIQTSKYIIREAALADSFQPENCDWLIEVTANRETRLQRVILRSRLTEEEFNKRDSLQKKNEKIPSNKLFTIENNEGNSILNDILAIHEKLNA
ncbi:MAG: dephospho-CoA kinase [Flavobacteriales bacterium]|jgi:dephospho-CoA kinase|nr:dephospho-CoA kinase [Flavobacteriales bacterium]MDP4716964.1 dephospho-CoA kinase [Flavobacteriales bacterium]MDP4731289.1 dephospho-CoA kinase [Flavobacteriales bacterium]MDP4818803.1 dephospho-CoA kinase [Flavobacteriales bacterium]MDP4951278.1 dephospho-CoA kinase [Flavobacteriales bacterium]